MMGAGREWAGLIPTAYFFWAGEVDCGGCEMSHIFDMRVRWLFGFLTVGEVWKGRGRVESGK